MSRAPKGPGAHDKAAPHINFRNDMFDSPAFRSCGPLARCLLFEIARRRGPTNNGFIYMSQRQAEEECGTTSRKGIIAAIAELCAKGLLIQTFKADQTAPGMKKDDNKFTRYLLPSHGYFAEGGRWIEPLGTYMGWDVDGGVDFTGYASKIIPPVQVEHESKDQEGYRQPGQAYVAPAKSKPAKVSDPVPSFPEAKPSKIGKPVDLVIAQLLTSGAKTSDGRMLTRAVNAEGVCIAESWCRPGEIPTIGVHDDVPF